MKPIYTLGMIQFPRIPNIERFIDNFMDKIRHEYPIDYRSSSEVYNASIVPGGVKIERQEAILWQFTSIDQNWGFVLSNQSICLHTNKYQKFEHFVEKFRSGIIALINISNIEISWFSTIGIRFVSMVVPVAEETLGEIIQPWALPIEPSEAPLEIIEGIHVSRYKTEFGELRFQALRNPEITLPHELNTPLVQKNGWVMKKPIDDFALIDIDHSTRWVTPQKLDVDIAMDTLKNLRKISKEVSELAVISKTAQIYEGI